MVRPLLRPDIGAAAEVVPVLKLQQSPLALRFLEKELQLSRTLNIKLYHCTLVFTRDKNFILFCLKKNKRKLHYVKNK